jgi:hypothetical protein
MNMRIESIVSFIVSITMSMVISIACQGQDIIRTNVYEIKKNPLEFEGKVVRLEGHLESGHWGVLLQSKDHNTAIRLRSPNIVDCPVPVLRDSLFEQFWSTNTEIPSIWEPEWKGIEIEIEGYVRLLKENGEIVEEFYLYGQHPIEVITTRIIKYNILK